jgi:hypothetical protein
MCLFAFDRDDTYIHQSRSRSFRCVYLVLLYGTYLRYDVFNRFDNLGLARVAVHDCLGGILIPHRLGRNEHAWHTVSALGRPPSGSTVYPINMIRKFLVDQHDWLSTGDDAIRATDKLIYG